MGSLNGSLIGFCGIGRMGIGMATSLLKNGAKVVCCDKNKASTQPLVERGAEVVDTPAQLGSLPGLKAILSMLPDPPAVRDVYLGPQGLIQSEELSAPLVIDCSTIDPETSREVAQAVESSMLCPAAVQRTGRMQPKMIDAPVSGGVPASICRTLTFMCGGDEFAVRDAEPYLLSMGNRVIRVGDHGAGQAAKLANNLVLAVSMAAVSESLAWGQRQGLDPALLTQIFNLSSAQCWASQKYNPVPGIMDGVPSSRGYKNGFPLHLMLKDLTLATGVDNDEESCFLPMAKVAMKVYKDALKLAPDANLDFSSIYELFYDGQPSQ